MMYLIFTMIVLLNIVVFPSISLFPFMWIPLLGTMVINIFINNNLIRCITIIVILLLSVYILVMDLIGCLFFIQNNYLCYSFVIFSFFSFLNVLVSVKLLIDELIIFSQPAPNTNNYNEKSDWPGRRLDLHRRNGLQRRGGQSCGIRLRRQRQHDARPQQENPVDFLQHSEPAQWGEVRRRAHHSLHLRCRRHQAQGWILAEQRAVYGLGYGRPGRGNRQCLERRMEQGNSLATSKEYLNAHSKAKLADPRFVEPDISLDRNTGIFYINDKEKESVLKWNHYHIL